MEALAGLGIGRYEDYFQIVDVVPEVVKEVAPKSPFIARLEAVRVMVDAQGQVWLEVAASKKVSDDFDLAAVNGNLMAERFCAVEVHFILLFPVLTEG